jgi:hypothetical protein
MIYAALLSLTIADPTALRAPHEGRGITAVAGAPVSSLAVQFAGGVGVAVALHLPASAISVDLGYKRLWLGDEQGWSLQTALWGGILIPIVDLDLAVDFGLSLHARVHRGLFVGAFGAAVPASLRLTSGLLPRLPVTADLWLGLEIGPVQFGVQGAAGAILFAAPGPSLYLQGSLYAAIGF